MRVAENTFRRLNKDDEDSAVLLKRIKLHIIVQNNHDVCDDMRSTMKMGTRVMTQDLVTSAAGSTEFFPTKHFFREGKNRPFARRTSTRRSRRKLTY